MAPTKFEHNIKDKLDERTLSPSADAWDKLSERLNQNKKRHTKPLWWWGIAASTIGMLLVAFQFFNNDVETDTVPKIVITPEVVKQDKTNKIASDNVKNIEEVSEEIKLEESKKSNQIKNKTIIIQPNLIKENSVIAKENVTPKLKAKSLKLDKNTSKNLTFEAQKIQDVVTQIKNLKTNNTVVTDETIDALLAEAQKEIALKKLYNQTKGVVDANVLLQDVEAELDQSFRNKVFKALKENFVSLKTAVAQRND